MIQFADATNGVYLNLKKGIVYNDGHGGTDHISGINSVYGTLFNDRMYGGGSEDGWFNGYWGNDVLVASKSSTASFGLYGDDGDDTLIGNAGNNDMLPGAGNDSVFGRGGDDVLEYGYLATEGALIRLDRGLVENDGNGGRDIIKDIHNVRVDSLFNDTIYGDAQDNDIQSYGGTDLIYGQDGNDHLELDSGILLGGHGNDSLFTHRSVVLINGGPDADQVTLQGPKYPIERVWLGEGDTLTDDRYAPDSADPVPTNTLQLPAPTSNPESVWYLNHWVLQ